MAEGDAHPKSTGAAARSAKFGQGFLTDCWYFAALSGDVGRGSLQRVEMLGEPVLLGRGRDGKVFALRDICPHRAAPLSAGRMTAEADGTSTVECPYHGWRFDTAGTCRAIPSLADGQDFEAGRVRIRSWPVAESQGMVFVWMASDPRFEGQPDHPPPAFPGVVGGAPKLVDRMVFDSHIDHAVVGLMDPAHGPYVHQQWWWRTSGSQHDKAKAFEPREAGFAMAAHTPSKNSRAYAVLGGAPVTEITFRLPGLRWEHTAIGPLRQPKPAWVSPIRAPAASSVTPARRQSPSLCSRFSPTAVPLEAANRYQRPWPLKLAGSRTPSRRATLVSRFRPKRAITPASALAPDPPAPMPACGDRSTSNRPTAMLKADGQLRL